MKPRTCKACHVSGRNLLNMQLVRDKIGIEAKGVISTLSPLTKSTFREANMAKKNPIVIPASETIVPKENLIGQRFCSLTVIEFLGRDRKLMAFWRYRCDCGTEGIKRTRSLKGHYRECTHPAPCAFDGCNQLQRSRKYCVRHYNLLLRSGQWSGEFNEAAFERRFWAKVDKTSGQGPWGDCWTWTAHKNSRGYGTISYQGRSTGAPRASFLLSRGYFPEHFALHKCDNPPCVRPDHLWDGTNLENVRDRDVKGRNAKGMGVASSKLCDADIRAIRTSPLDGPKLARIYDVAASTIYQIKHRRRWRHVPDEG